MSKKIPAFGQSETDELVTRYLARGPITPDDVLSYSINRGPSHSTLTLEILFQDDPATTKEGE